MEIAKTKKQLLENLLQVADFAGLKNGTLNDCAKELGISQGQLEIITPNGVLSMVDFWFSLADDNMVEGLQARKSLKIREKAAFAIRARLEFLGQHKEALRNAIVLLALPSNAKQALAIGYRFADCAWRAFGDTSTDFNHYTKRTMLLGVDVATAAFYLADDSIENQETWDFLDRRIENIMQIEKAKAGIKGIVAKIPDPIPFLAKLRFGAKPMP